MMRSKAKLLESLVNDFLESTAQQAAPNLTGAQARAKLKEMDSQDLLSKIEDTIKSDFALKHLQPSDIVFKEFNVQTNPTDNTQYLVYTLSFSKNILSQVNAAVARNKAAHPNFMLSNYVKNVIQRLNPGMPARGTVVMG